MHDRPVGCGAEVVGDNLQLTMSIVPDVVNLESQDGDNLIKLDRQAEDLSPLLRAWHAHKFGIPFLPLYFWGALEYLERCFQY